MTDSPRYIVLDVLAAAYKGKRANLEALLTHASIDGVTALCASVKRESLTEAGSTEVTCPRCRAKMEVR